ncbi:MAG: hypothetical protein E7294_04820 [Lachnospiraceae bacterium]|nr:hypothetical protein [Lachnospiraceae bacterium]
MSQETSQDSKKKTTAETAAEEKTVHKAKQEVRERPRKASPHRPVKEEVGGVEEFAEQFKEDRMFAGYIIGGVVILLAIIIIAVYAASSGDRAQKEPETKVEESQTVEQEETPADGTAQEQPAPAETETEPAEPEFVDDGSLQEDAYEEVNSLVKEYFDAMASGDGDKIMQLKSDTSEEELLKLETKSAYIEGYENIKVYTKLGPVDSSYVAFVSYDINFKDVNTLAPGLTTMYICQGDDGKLGIYDGALDENVAQCIKDAATDAEAVDLINRTQVAYNEAIEADADLKKFMDELPTRLGTEVAAAMEAKEKDSNGDAESAGNTDAAPADTQEAAPADTAAASTQTVMASEAVNVRASDSENADKIGRLDAGAKVTRYEAKENGWSRIDYNGQEGYVKSEFLQVVSGDSQPAADNTQPAQTDNAAASADNGGGQSQGTVTIKESVNVRASSGEGAEKLGNAFAGETYKLLMKQEDGWSKIQYGDKVGYVKSEYVTFN